MKYILLSLFLSACAVPEVKSPVTMEDVNAATADPNFGGMFLVFMVAVMFLALCLLPGSR